MIKQLSLSALSIWCFSIPSFAQSNIATPKSGPSHFKMPESVLPSDYMAHTIVAKLKPEYRPSLVGNTLQIPAFNQAYLSLGGAGLKRKFPAAQAPEKPFNERGEKLVDLSTVLEFTYSADMPIEKVIDLFQRTGLFVYVEPHYLPHTCFTPNDPGLGSQYAITKIQAEAAWGVNTTTARGDTNVVIGITDTGTEPTHSDLQGNIKHNYADPIGGGDNDGDGYIDNYSGWDLGENDNDPTYGASAHGVHVSGIAAASTNNSNGVAGVGFNCKFLPVKIADAGGNLTMAYEGITYAADHGCAIINCSWGGSGGGSLGQDVVNYATFNKNALVVAAAGNNGVNQDFYPASYTNVISVANTNNSDVAAASTNYGFNIDVCAPGEGIYSTFPTNSYSSLSGTSMASPCAAGAAAIIKSFFPSYSALQVGEQLKVTCDNIYPVNSVTYLNRLGYGRVNLYKALTQTSSPSVVTNSMSITDNNDNAFVANDTLRFAGQYTNYLAAASNVTATLSSASPYVTVIDGSSTLGNMPTLGTANNVADPFKVKILATAPVNASIAFKLVFADAATSYSHTEYFNVVVNVDYVNIAINDVATTITSNGKIGYRADGQSGGLGFTYMGGGTILYEAGLMIGTSAATVSDVVRGTGTASDADFASLVRAHVVTPPAVSEFDVDGSFKDNTSASPLPVTVHHSAYAWTTAGNRKYVMVKYMISNTGTATLNNLYAGIFADWDIDASTFASNRASFDATNRMGYAFYTGASGTYAGIKLLSHTGPVVHYAIDNIAGGGGGIDLYTSGFDGTEKYTTLSTNRSDAGVSGAGNDIADVVSSGPFTLSAGDSVEISFALLAGDDLADLQNSAVNAQTMYDNISSASTGIMNPNSSNGGMMVFPNPANNRVTVEVQLGQSGRMEVELFDLLGKRLTSLVMEDVPVGTQRIDLGTAEFSAGIYTLRVKTSEGVFQKKLILNK